MYLQLLEEKNEHMHSYVDSGHFPHWTQDDLLPPTRCHWRATRYITYSEQNLIQKEEERSVTFIFSTRLD